MKRACAALLVTSFAALAGCKTPCKEGKLDAAWQAAPLSALVPEGATVCEGSTATSTTFWKASKVHDASMTAVDKAQSNGFERSSDNWYKSLDHSESPKWSELAGPAGKLRIDVKESGGGASITYKLTK